MENIKIGNVVLNNKVVLAPMAGFTTSAFRQIVKKMGASLVYSELISDKAIYYNNNKTLDLLEFDESERPIAIQLFGYDIDTMVYAAKYIERNYHPDIIDINMGCPVTKVAIKCNAGSALLKEPSHCYDLVKSIVNNVNIPVTVKIRSGWDHNSVNAVEIAKLCESAGAKAIAVHARTKSDGYSGKIDLDVIKEVKKSVNIPVIGNGDIKSVEDAKTMLLYTKCDAVMIGRGVLGNPWLVKEICSSLNNNNNITKITNKERIAMLKEHYLLLCSNKGELTATLEMRTNALYYLKYLPNSKDIKLKIFSAKTKEDFINIINDYEKNNLQKSINRTYIKM